MFVIFWDYFDGVYRFNNIGGIKKIQMFFSVISPQSCLDDDPCLMALLFIPEALPPKLGACKPIFL